MTNLSIGIFQEENGPQVFQLTGPFTIGTMSDFQTLVRERKAAVTLIDLRAVPYMDSWALGSLLGFHVSCQRDGRKYGLVGAAPRLKSLFKVAGVDGILVMYDTMAAARKLAAKA